MISNMQTLGIRKLSLNDRITLLDEIWESVAEDLNNDPADGQLVQDLKDRLSHHQANPNDSSSWEEFKKELLAE